MTACKIEESPITECHKKVLYAECMHNIAYKYIADFTYLNLHV